MRPRRWFGPSVWTTGSSPVVTRKERLVVQLRVIAGLDPAIHAAAPLLMTIWSIRLTVASSSQAPLIVARALVSILGQQDGEMPMPKRTLGEDEKQTIVATASQQALAQYPGSMVKVVVAKQTDDNGAPQVKILLAGQSEGFVTAAD
jgi:hypothetical protein